MNRNLKDLVLLQEIDSERRGLKQQQQEIPKQVESKKSILEQKEKMINDRREELKALQRSIDSKELDLKKREENIIKLQTQLNMAKTNKEYSAFLTEINGIKANNSLIEDEILQMMSTMEDIEAECATMEEELAKERENLNAEIKKSDEDLQILNDNIRKLNREREEIVSRVDKEFLDKYERLLHNRDGIAIASGEGQVCHACHISLTLQTMNDLKTSDEIVFCHSCGRILHLEEE